MRRTLLPLLFGLAGLARAEGPAQELTRLTLVGMNDIHGAALPAEQVLRGKAVKIGGLDAAEAYLAAIRRTNPNTLLFLAGDLFQGTPLSNLFKGQSLLPLYNALGVTAATMGNHELDYGQAAFREIVYRSSFPWILGNVQTEDRAGETPFSDTGRVSRTGLFETGGVKVGVVALTALSTPADAGPVNAAGLAFGAYAASARRDLADLRAAGAQVMVLLAHDGGGCDMARPPEDGDAACQADDPVTQLLAALPANSFQAVIAGHTHSPQAHFIRGTPVIQSREGGRSLGLVDLWVDAAGKVERAVPHKPLPLCHQVVEGLPTCDARDLTAAELAVDSGSEAVVTDPLYEGRPVHVGVRMAGLLQPFAEELRPVLERVAADLPADLPNDRTQESPASDCLADIAKAAFEAKTGRRADLAFTNSGKVRAAFAKGPLTYERVYNVMPFDFRAELVSMTGAELNALAAAYNIKPKDISVISAGWTLHLAPDFPRHRGFLTPAGERLADDARLEVLLLGDYTSVFPELFEKARAEGRVFSPGLLLRDLVFDGLAAAGEALPEACKGAASTPRMVIFPDSPAS